MADYTGDVQAESDEDFGGVFTQDCSVKDEGKARSRKSRRSTIPEIGISPDGIPFFLNGVKKKKRKKGSKISKGEKKMRRSSEGLL